MTNDDLNKEIVNINENISENKQPTLNDEIKDKMPEENPEEIYTGREVTTFTLLDKHILQYCLAVYLKARELIKKIRLSFILIGIGIFFLAYFFYYFFSNEYIKFLLTFFPIVLGICLIILAFFYPAFVNYFFQRNNHNTAVRQIIKIREDKIFWCPNLSVKHGLADTLDWSDVIQIIETDCFYFIEINNNLNISTFNPAITHAKIHPIITITKDPRQIMKGDYKTLTAIIGEKIKTKPYRFDHKIFIS